MSGFSMQAPWWLLLFVPALIVALSVRGMRRRRAAGLVRFTGSQMLSDLVRAPRRRRAPVVLAVIGTILCILGLSAPQLPVILEQQRANVVLLIDISGSMSANDVAPTRLAAAQKAASQFLENLPAQWKAGLVAFSEHPVLVTAPTDDRAAVTAGLQSLVPTGGTGTGDAISMAIDVGRAGSADRIQDAMNKGDSLENPSKTVIVLLSDGRPTVGNTTAQAAAYRAQRLGIPIFAIAFGTDQGAITVLDAGGQEKVLQVPPDPGTMQELASITNAGYFTALSEDQLKQVYQSVSSQLEKEAGTYSLQVPLLLAGLLLLAIAALLAARRSPLP